MSDAQKIMADVLRVHQYNGAAEGTLGARSEFCTCGWSGPGEQVHEAHQAAEIDRAVGGLHRSTQPEYPERWEAGEKVCDAGRLVSRWVSDWVFL